MMNLRATRTPLGLRTAILALGLLVIGGLGVGPCLAEDAEQPPLDRTVLPMKAPYSPPIKILDARDAKVPPRWDVRAPRGAPNVVVIMIDDLGFAGMSAFGGVTSTPTFDTLAKNGLRFNQFHSTAICSATRQALLTGRNHHSVNMGSVAESATAFPGNTGVLPADCSKLPEILRLNGYSTAHFGKCHEIAPWEISPSGPLTRWPTLVGFDKFYGFLGGETNQWSPALYDGVTPVSDPTKGNPDYHFMNDMTTQAIQWVRAQQSLTPDKPFFVYFVPGATHAPHHVPKSYIKKHEGKFDEGWDVIRKRIFENQKRLGVIPQDTKLARKPEAIQDWADLSADEKKMFARQAEVFSAYLDMADTEIGRFIQAIDDLGDLDNTLLLFIAGDNGTSAEGGLVGVFNEMSYFNGVAETVQEELKHYDDWGSPSTYPHMAAGWAVCFDTPFTWTKQVASNYGGTRQGMVVHWPNGIKAQGELRSQWHHVIDVTPTILEAIGLPQPRIVNSVGQRPMEGVSMAYAFDEAAAADRHLVQYFEIFGNRALYYDGWYAGTIHKAPWEDKPRHKLTEDKWELYHVAEDFGMATDVAGQYPAKLKELRSMFIAEAEKYKVLPIDDRTVVRINPKLAGRPDLMDGRTTLTMYEGLGFLGENDFINTKQTSFDITAEIECTEGKTNGVIVSQAGRFGGWSLYVKDDKLIYVYNFLGMNSYSIAADSALAKGKSTVRLDFAIDDAKKLGSGGMATLYINGKKVGSGRVEKTHYGVWSFDETANVGIDRETPVTPDYTEETSRFSAKIHKVTISLKK